MSNLKLAPGRIKQNIELVLQALNECVHTAIKDINREPSANADKARRLSHLGVALKHSRIIISQMALAARRRTET